MEKLTRPNEWRKDTILAQEKNILDYVGGLGLYLDDFDGKILDLGSGAEQVLNQNVQAVLKANPQLELHPEITSVSPDMINETFRKHLRESPGFENKTVAAVGQQLPFKDGSFDRVLSLGSLINYAGFEQGGGDASEAVVQAWMSEVVRILKPGGEARLGMIYGEQNNQSYLDAFKSLNLGAEISIEQAMDDSGKPFLTTHQPPQNVYRIVIRKS